MRCCNTQTLEFELTFSHRSIEVRGLAMTLLDGAARPPANLTIYPLAEPHDGSYAPEEPPPMPGYDVRALPGTSGLIVGAAPSGAPPFNFASTSPLFRVGAAPGQPPLPTPLCIEAAALLNAAWPIEALIPEHEAGRGGVTAARLQTVCGNATVYNQAACEPILSPAADAPPAPPAPAPAPASHVAVEGIATFAEDNTLPGAPLTGAPCCLSEISVESAYFVGGVQLPLASEVSEIARSLHHHGVYRSPGAVARCPDLPSCLSYDTLRSRWFICLQLRQPPRSNGGSQYRAASCTRHTRSAGTHPLRCLRLPTALLTRTAVATRHGGCALAR